MTDEAKPVDPIDTTADAVAFLEAAYNSSDGTPDGAVADTGTHSDEMTDEAIDTELAAAEETDGSSGNAATPSGGKKPGRWAKTKQKLTDAVAATKTLQENNQALTDQVLSWQAEVQSQTTEAEIWKQRAIDYGYAPTEAESKLSAYEERERRTTHKQELDKVSAERRGEFERQQQTEAIKAEVTQYAGDLGMGVRQFVAYAMDQNVTPAAAFAALQQQQSAGANPAATQLHANNLAPTLVTRSATPAVKASYAPGSNEHAEAMLMESALYRQ